MNTCNNDIISDVTLFDSRMKEKNTCPNKGLAWKREFIRIRLMRFYDMHLSILRWKKETWIYAGLLSFSPCTFSYNGWLPGLWNIWEWTWRIINSSPTSIFLCGISQSVTTSASVRPFWILTINLLPLTLAGKQNLHWFPRILCHSRCTRRFLINCIMISASKTKWCLAESKEGNNVI